jgi:hypothetical protein
MCSSGKTTAAGRLVPIACSRPIRLRATETVDVTTGELFDGDWTAHVPCGDRRSSRCGYCSDLYNGDVYQVVRSGYRPALPYLWLTLTAPSFGPQHHRACYDRKGKRNKRPCTPRRTCPGCGAPVAPCKRWHRREDPLVGTPACGCFDYDAAARWNAHVGKLWSATAELLRNDLQRRDRSAVLHAVAVREAQARGLMHIHVLLRHAAWSADRLQELCARAVVRDQDGREYRWGRTSHPAEREAQGFDVDDVLDFVRGLPPARSGDVVLLRPGRGEDARRRFGYIAKYVQKDLAEEFDAHSASGARAQHLMRFRTAARRVAPESCPRAERARTADIPYEHNSKACRSCKVAGEQLGFRGHLLTKTRSWGITLGECRERRRRYGRRNVAATQRIMLRLWQYDGRGRNAEAAMIERLIAQHADGTAARPPTRTRRRAAPPAPTVQLALWS